MPKRIPRKLNQLRKSEPMAFIVIVLVAFGVLSYFAYQRHKDQEQTKDLKALVVSNRRLAKQGKQAHDAICVLKDELASNVAGQSKNRRRTALFLRNHPHGIPGIPYKLFKVGYDDQVRAIQRTQGTIRSLDANKCPPVAKKRS